MRKIRSQKGLHDKLICLSIDTSICERFEDVSGESDAQEVASNSFFGLFSSLFLANKFLESQSENDQADFGIIAIYLHNESYQLALQKDFLGENDRAALGNDDIQSQEIVGYEVGTLQYEWLSYPHNFSITIESLAPPNSINNFGLFSSLSTAEKVRDSADINIPEHAPFGLWGVAILTK